MPSQQMNNTQLYLSIGIPTLTVILAWLSNGSDINRLNDKVYRLGDSLRAEMTTFRREKHESMLDFRRESHEAMIGFRRAVHEDLLMLHERVVRVETRQENLC